METPTSDTSPEAFRRLFHLKALAGERHRAAMARSLGMSDTEATALAHLAQHGQLTPGELGGLLSLTSGGTTALLQRLEQAGHVVRHPHPHDRRSSLVTATRPTLERAAEIYAPLVRDMDQIAARLSVEERAVVGRYLADVVAVSERHAERLDAAARSEPANVVAAPAPGLWA